MEDIKMQKRKEYYYELDKTYENEVKKLERTYSRISTFRIITFLLGAMLLFVGIGDHIVVLAMVGIFCLIFFVFLVSTHGTCSKNTEIAKSKLVAVRRYRDRMGDSWREFYDTGNEFLSEKDTVAKDIDLLGKNSLYQMISVCHTDQGKRKLADNLKNQKIHPDLEDRREAIHELMDKRQFLIDFEAAGIRLSERKHKPDVGKFENYCSSKIEQKLPGWMNVLRFALPVIEIILLFLFLTNVIHYGYALVGFLLTLVLSWLTKTITDSIILPFYGMGQVTDDYLDMMLEVERESFASKKMCEIKESLCGEKGALSAFKKLHTICQAYNVSFNPLLHQVLSGLVLWDYQLASIMIKWKKTYGGNVANCFGKIGEIEELCSLSVVGIVRHVSDAKIVESEKCRLKCENLYHPLIAMDKVVSNSATLYGGITIITGSNMSGKTTFLRTLAVNLVLAYMGAPVCGDLLEANNMKIFTSMRISDDVANGISTFYAEILRIKSMADYQYKKEKHEKMLCLIDEIFKGTNSADRIVGAKEAIKQLAGDTSMTIVSTHDFELCNMEDRAGEKAWNYHFEEYYEDDELRFDYKIKDGRCTTTNAKALLKMAGFTISES